MNVRTMLLRPFGSQLVWQRSLIRGFTFTNRQGVSFHPSSTDLKPMPKWTLRPLLTGAPGYPEPIGWSVSVSVTVLVRAGRPEAFSGPWDYSCFHAHGLGEKEADCF